MKLILFLLFTTVSCQQLQNANFTLPMCGFNTNFKKRRSRIAFISHDSTIATFFHNPEQGSRDAANIVDLDVEWNRYMTATESRMAHDIRAAVDNGIDGIIASIPNDLVYEAIQYANSKQVPIIVFNSGLDYAKTLGLARVMQDDFEAGLIIGQRIENGNFSRPLVVHLSNMENKTINLRINGIQKAMLGKGLGLLNITETLANSTFTPVQLIGDTFKDGLYDSIISLGGSLCADLVSTAVLSIKRKYPDLSIASGFFDVGGNNMTELFNKEKNTFAVTQLPYYQTALPVFYMYLRLTTGHDIYFNRTIKTGPNLITNETLPMVLKNEQNSLMNINDKFGSIGAIVPNSRGDTYNSAMMAGVFNLAYKLNWTVINPIREDPIDISKSFRQDLDYFMKKRRTSNIVLQTSDQTLLDYAANRSRRAPDVGVAAIGTFFERFNQTYKEMPNIGLDMKELAQSVAKKVVEDGNSMPICYSERTAVFSNPFCRYFYNEYQALVGSTGQPSFNHVVQSIHTSSISAMEDEFVNILNNLKSQGYVPDSFISFSENIFSIINNRMLKGYLSNDTAFYTGGELFDQNQAFLEGRVKGLWATNFFAIGFMTLLYSLLSRVMTTFPSWEGALISAPRIERVCDPGTYHVNLTTDAYCQDSQGHTRMSIQCIQCPENTYSANPNQAYCDACQYGTYSFVGSSACTSCYDSPKIVNNTICENYITEQQSARKQLFMAIFIPIGIVLFSLIIGFIVWYGRRRFSKQRAIGSDENWLLSFEELVKPKTTESSGDREDAFTREKQRDIIMGANSRLFVGESSTNPASGLIKKEITSVIAQEQTIADDSYRFSNGGDTLTPSLPEPNLISTLEVEGGTHHKRGGSKIDEIKFQAEDNGLIHALGFYRNLPVYIKQIGYKKVRVDENVRKEVSFVKDARHPNLIEFVGLILEPQRTFIVEEYCTKGSLSDVLADPDINLAWIFRFSLINDLISGMRFLHRSKFLYHGCLTSNTCMITGRWELKISNYGFNHIKNTQIDITDPPTLVKKHISPLNTLIDDVTPSQEQVTQILRSPKSLLWLAPESIVVLPLNVYITYPSKEADVYSVGIIINEVLTREKPYNTQLNDGLSYEKIFDQICKLELRPHMQPSSQDDFTHGMNLIVSDCLQKNSHARPSFNAIASRVEEIDPYFCGSDSVIDNMAVLLEKYGNDMENLVKKRTFNLQQRTLELEEERARTETLLKDLKLAKEVAEAAAASKQNFLANMSHEIRTPMNAVIGMSRTLMESDLPPDLYECAETIESSGNHLMALIDDILDYSKIDSGKLTLERSMLDLTYVVESAIKLISSNYLSKELVLWYNISPDLPVHVFGDIVRLRQILLNLLSNAFKFTQTGYVYVSVELYKQNPNSPTHQGEDDDYNILYPATGSAAQSPTTRDNDINPLDIVQYLFSVKDSGIGIPKEKAKKLFKTFSQVDASTTRNFGGTGLGLAISKKLCKIMGGDMWVESDEGKGSTFSFKVNLQKQPNSNTYSEENNLKELTKECPNPLIIAERDIVQFEWNSLLKNFGIENITAMNINETYNNFKKKDISKESYSIIIIDMDFETLDKNLQESTTSQSVLTRLKKEYNWVQHIPTLCIIDNRSKKTRKRVSEELEAKFSSSVIQHPQGFREPAPTPIDDIANPFDNVTTNSQRNSAILISKSSSNASSINLAQPENKHLVLKKPFKNSSLVSILHQLLSLEPRSLARNQRLGSMNSINGRLSQKAADRIRQDSTEESERSLAYLASIKTLIVDDNPVNLKVLSRMLTQIGISSQSANNGREAYETVLKASKTEDPFHLVFMDIWMPELNGFEATEKIRKEAASSGTQPYIIALTACVMTGDREKCMEAGMNGYVSKPIRKEELEAAIHTFTQTTSNETIFEIAHEASVGIDNAN